MSNFHNSRTVTGRKPHQPAALVFDVGEEERQSGLLSCDPRLVQHGGFRREGVDHRLRRAREDYPPVGGG